MVQFQLSNHFMLAWSLILVVNKIYGSIISPLPPTNSVSSQKGSSPEPISFPKSVSRKVDEAFKRCNQFSDFLSNTKNRQKPIVFCDISTISSASASFSTRSPQSPQTNSDGHRNTTISSTPSDSSESAWNGIADTFNPLYYSSPQATALHQNCSIQVVVLTDAQTPLSPLSLSDDDEAETERLAAVGSSREEFVNAMSLRLVGGSLFSESQDDEASCWHVIVIYSTPADLRLYAISSSSPLTNQQSPSKEPIRGSGDDMDNDDDLSSCLNRNYRNKLYNDRQLESHGSSGEGQDAAEARLRAILRWILSEYQTTNGCDEVVKAGRLLYDGGGGFGQTAKDAIAGSILTALGIFGACVCTGCAFLLSRGTDACYRSSGGVDSKTIPLVHNNNIKDGHNGRQQSRNRTLTVHNNNSLRVDTPTSMISSSLHQIEEERLDLPTTTDQELSDLTPNNSISGGSGIALICSNSQKPDQILPPLNMDQITVSEIPTGRPDYDHDEPDIQGGNDSLPTTSLLDNRATKKFIPNTTNIEMAQLSSSTSYQHDNPGKSLEEQSLISS